MKNDQIIVKGLRVFGYHGVNAEEKRDGQWFNINIIAETDLSAAAASDNLDDTVSYAKILKRAAAILSQERYDLLEAAAMRVICVLLEDFPALQRITVCLQKPQAPIHAEFSWVGVELSRSREDLV